MGDPLLEVRDVSREFTVRRRPLRALDGVSLSVEAGDAYGIAGESGSGKSTLVRLILLLDRPTSGSVLFRGRDLATLDRAGKAAFRRAVQAVFQDTTASLNPRQRVRDLVAEPLEAHGIGTRRDVDRRVRARVVEVGLPERVLRSFPHQLSGGQRQRVAIARALAIEPELVVLDEPVSALDMSIRSQVLNLLLELKERHGLTYLLVAHDLALLRHVTDRVAVMYLGRVVERGPTDSVYARPGHPYTRALLDAAPGSGIARSTVEGEGEGEGTASALALPSGCRFHPRCPSAFDRCPVEDPPLYDAGPEHEAACHLLDALHTQQGRLAAAP